MPLTKHSFSINKTDSSKIKDIDWDNLVFGKQFSDHMLMIDYKDGEWQQGEIVPFDNLHFFPFGGIERLSNWLAKETSVI